MHINNITYSLVYTYEIIENNAYLLICILTRQKAASSSIRDSVMRSMHAYWIPLEGEVCIPYTCVLCILIRARTVVCIHTRVVKLENMHNAYYSRVRMHSTPALSTSDL